MINQNFVQKWYSAWQMPTLGVVAQMVTEMCKPSDFGIS